MLKARINFTQGKGMKQPGKLHLHRGGSDDKSGGERDVKKEK